MKKILKVLAISGTLTLGSGQKAFSDEVKTQVSYGQNNVTQVISSNKNSTTDSYESILNTELSKVSSITDEEKKQIQQVLSSPEVKETIIKVLNEEKQYSLSYYILSLISFLIYFYLYSRNYAKVKEGHETETLTYAGFALSSSISLYLTGISFSNLILLQSAVFGSLIAVTNYFNIKNGNTVSDKMGKAYILSLENSPYPVVRYDKNGKPLLWNKKMEEETGYTFIEVLNYYNTYGEVMSLLYKGDELERVKQYLSQIDETGKGYQNVAFTLVTKDGVHKTFLWTTQPDGIGGTIRTAKELTDEFEIQRELNETLKLLRLDPLTGALNVGAFNNDLRDIFTQKERGTDPSNLVIAMLDIDDFKQVNEVYGHNTGDEVLKKLTNTILSNIRSDDRVYRIGGDEFIIIFKTNDFQLIVNKINIIREIFFNDLFFLEGKTLSGVGTSWGLRDFNLRTIKNEFHQQKIKKIEDIKGEVDYYMYSVKHLKYIEEELTLRGVSSHQIMEKNSIAYPIFDENNLFSGVKIINGYGELFVSKGELDLIIERKQPQVLENKE